MARPLGIEPSPYTGALAKHLGIKPQALRYQLTHAGLKAPYLDVEQALSVLETKKLFAKKIAKFRERMATDVKFRELMTGKPGNGKSHAYHARTPEMEAVKVRKFKAQHKRKLMPRLATHLVRMKLAKNYKRAYMKAVFMLRRAGLPGKPGSWRDEARCVELFKEAGIDMSTFEYADEIQMGDGQALIPAPSTAVVPRKGNGAAQVLQTAPMSEESRRRALEGLRRARVSLEQWRHSFFERAQRRQKTDFDDDDGMVVEALINIRRVPSGR